MPHDRATSVPKVRTERPRQHGEVVDRMVEAHEHLPEVGVDELGVDRGDVRRQERMAAQERLPEVVPGASLARS